MPAEFDEGERVRRMLRTIERPEEAAKQLGTIMVAESQQSFREQKFGDRAWKERSTPNVFGIIADFYAGKKTIPQRRFEPRPALRDSGRLMASIAFRVMEGGHIVEVGTALPHAAVHQHGGEVVSKPINEQVRRSLNEFLKGKGKQHRKTLGWLLNKKFEGKSLRQTVPARPFVGISDQTVADAVEILGTSISEAK